MGEFTLGPNRAYPNTPTIGDTLESHTVALKQIVEALSIYERRIRTGQGDSFVRVSELESLGIANIANGTVALDIGSSDLTIVTSTSHTMGVEEDVILVDDDAAGAAVSVKLQSATTAKKRRVDVKKIGSTAPVTISGVGSETIDGGSSAILYTQYENLTLFPDGTNWVIL